MRIQDLMSTRVTSIAPDAEVSVAREKLRLEGINHLVVVNGKRVVGVVTRGDILQAPDDTLISQVMSHPAVTTSPEVTMRRAAGVMRGRGVGCLPVVEEGRLVGIVTTSDLLTALAKGEIHAAPPRERVILRKRGARKQPAH